jgi:hypothetical protein
MLNRIIRLQAVVEIITRKTASALELLAKQQTQMRVLHIKMAWPLGYLLVEEGGVCQVQLINCRLHIDNTNIRKWHVYLYKCGKGGTRTVCLEVGSLPGWI